METKLFHKDIFIPEQVVEIVKKQQKVFKGFDYTEHMMENFRSRGDRSHGYSEREVTEALRQLNTINIFEPFEVEIKKDKELFGNDLWHVTKWCIRLKVDYVQELCISIRPRYFKGTSKIDFYHFKVITAWLNSSSDNHSTLDSSKYTTESDFYVGRK